MKQTRRQNRKPRGRRGDGLRGPWLFSGTRTDLLPALFAERDWNIKFQSWEGKPPQFPSYPAAERLFQPGVTCEQRRQRQPVTCPPGRETDWSQTKSAVVTCVEWLNSGIKAEDNSLFVRRNVGVIWVWQGVETEKYKGRNKSNEERFYNSHD